MATNAAIDVTGGLAPVATSGSAADLTSGELNSARLPNTITAGGPTGSASVVPVITYDAKGRLTAVTTATVTPAAIGAPAGSGNSTGTNTGDQTINAGTATGLSPGASPTVTNVGTTTAPIFDFGIPAGAAGATGATGAAGAAGAAGPNTVTTATTTNLTGLLKGDGANVGTATPGTDYAAASHNHAASDITSGTIDQARLGTGSAGTGAKFLADDQTYKTVSASLDIVGLTAGYPVLADSLPFYDLSATANRKATIALANAICSHYPGGRLSISSSSPFGITTSTGTSSLHYVPVTSSYIVLHDGTTWVQADFGSSISLTVSGGTSGKNYDVWCYLSGTTPTLGLSAAWTSDTARNETLAATNGIWHKNGDASRRYLGTIRLVSTTTFAHSQAQRFMWNLYHQQPLSLRYVDTTASWTYGTAAWRQARAQSAAKVEFVVGMDDALVDVELYALGSISAAAQHWIGLGLDTTSPTVAQPHTVTTAGELQHAGVAYRDTPGIGYHYLSWNEYSNATGTHTFYGYSSSTYESSLKGWVMG